MQKGVYISTGPAELTWHVGPARMQHDTQGHLAEPRGPTRGGGADTWQRHASPRERPGAPRGTRSEWVGRWWAHRLVGPGNSIGAVTQMCKESPPYIRAIPLFFFRVGLCSL